MLEIFSFVLCIKPLLVETTITIKRIAFFFGLLFLMAHSGFVFAQGHNLPSPPQKEEPATSHSFNTLGGVISGSGGTVSQSLGQLVYTSEESASGSLAQGVQRPYRLASVEIPPSVPALNFSILPNPTDGDLLLRLSDKPEEIPVYKVTDLQGRELLEGHVGFPETQIRMAGFASGPYLIQIRNTQNKPLQTLQIIKN
jgi:hypothetical protein